MKFSFENINRSFNIEQNEERIVYLMLLQSVFIGIFNGAFENTVSSLFLEEYSGEMVSRAYAVSGIVGVLLTAIYSFLHARIPFKNLASGNLLIISLLTILIWVGFNVFGSKVTVFAAMVLMGPLFILANIGFWGNAGRLFSLRQGKRLFGLIDSGIIVGGIISSYSIPLFLLMNFKTKDLLLISSVSIVLAFIIQFIIASGSKELSVKPVISSKNDKKQGSGFLDLFKSRFTSLLSVYAALSMVVAFFVAYSFLGAVKINYPEEIERTKFLGVFTGTMMFFTLVLKTAVYGKFMKTYGMKASLFISPAILGLFTVIAVLAGTIGGFQVATSGFILFFLVLTLSRLFSVSLKSSMEGPSFKILYQTISRSRRHQVQAQIDGSVNEVSATSSGFILVLLGLIPMFTLLNYIHVLMIITIVWLYISFRLYKAYKLNLDESLSAIKNSSTVTTEKNDDNQMIKIDQEADASFIIKKFQIIEQTQPLTYRKFLPDLLQNEHLEVKQYALEAIDRLNSYDILEEVRKKGIQLPEQVVSQLSSLHQSNDLRDQIVQLSKSRNPEDRVKAANLIGETRNQEMIAVLTTLLRDFDHEVRIAALSATSKVPNNRLYPLVVEFLFRDEYTAYATDTLESFGEPVIEYLEQAFNKTGLDPRYIKRIVKIIGTIGGEKAEKSLVQKIVYFQSGVSNIAVKALNDLKYTVKENELYLANQAIQRIISITAWNIAARSSFKEASEYFLVKMFQSELDQNYEDLFNLLGIIHDRETINHIYQSFIGNNEESSGFALELLDLIVSEDIKPMLFPLIDDIPDQEKIKQLQYFFPIGKIQLEALLIDIINRDSNSISHWIKACALWTIFSTDKMGVSDDIVAQIFNPDQLLSSIAFSIILKKKPELKEHYLKRLKPTQRQLLIENTKQIITNGNILLMDALLQLNQSKKLKDLSSDTIYQLCIHSEIITAQNLVDGSNLVLDTLNNIYIVTQNELFLNLENKTQLKLQSGDIFGGVFTNQDIPAQVTPEVPFSLIQIPTSRFSLLLHDLHDLKVLMLNIKSKAVFV